MALYGITPDMTLEQRYQARQAYLAKRAAVVPPTFTEYVRAHNVALAAEGFGGVSIMQLVGVFESYVNASIRRVAPRAQR
jgi:hypothetical protein